MGVAPLWIPGKGWPPMWRTGGSQRVPTSVPESSPHAPGHPSTPLPTLPGVRGTLTKDQTKGGPGSGHNSLDSSPELWCPQGRRQGWCRTLRHEGFKEGDGRGSRHRGVGSQGVWGTREAQGVGRCRGWSGESRAQSIRLEGLGPGGSHQPGSLLPAPLKKSSSTSVTVQHLCPGGIAPRGTPSWLAHSLPTTQPLSEEHPAQLRPKSILKGRSPRLWMVK